MFKNKFIKRYNTNILLIITIVLAVILIRFINVNRTVFYIYAISCVALSLIHLIYDLRFCKKQEKRFKEISKTLDHYVENVD